MNVVVAQTGPLARTRERLSLTLVGDVEREQGVHTMQVMSRGGLAARYAFGGARMLSASVG